MMKNIILLALAFVLGSIPFGIITAKARGVDLKKVGSGNIGATNVLRSLGKGPALITLLGDILKGTLAVAIGRYFGVEPLYEGLMGVAAIVGHNYSLFLGFRGGKGVATSIGVLLLYLPYAALITLLVWIVVVLVTKYSSLGAIVSFALLPLHVLLINARETTAFFISIFISLFIIIRHKDNIKRLIMGTERKIGQRE
mgnify:CR=1 FL=1